jgi:hypothetical protein
MINLTFVDGSTDSINAALFAVYCLNDTHSVKGSILKTFREEGKTTQRAKRQLVKSAETIAVVNEVRAQRYNTLIDSRVSDALDMIKAGELIPSDIQAVARFTVEGIDLYREDGALKCVSDETMSADAITGFTLSDEIIEKHRRGVNYIYTVNPVTA